MLKASRNLASSNYEKIFEEVYRKIDTMLDAKTAVDELKKMYKNGKATAEDNLTISGDEVNHAMTSGCTACCAIITSEKIFVGNLGDSRAVLAKNPPSDDMFGKDGLVAFDMSTDMKPDNEEE